MNSFYNIPIATICRCVNEFVFNFIMKFTSFFFSLLKLIFNFNSKQNEPDQIKCIAFMVQIQIINYFGHLIYKKKTKGKNYLLFIASVVQLTLIQLHHITSHRISLRAICAYTSTSQHCFSS